MKLSKSLKQAIYRHAQDCYPNECCGIIADGEFLPCANIAPDPVNFFEIDGEWLFDMLQIYEGDIIIVHSHPDGTPDLSEYDKVQMDLHGLDWLVVAVSNDIQDGWQFSHQYHTYQEHAPPLLGREYVGGVQDCYTLVRDYYLRELGVFLPDFPRVDGWWEDEHHTPLYDEYFAQAGFMVVDDLQPHDVIICRVGRTHHANHALIYLGDGKLQSENTPDCVGDCLILHHPHGRLSTREIYGESWQKRAVMVLRHQALIGKSNENH